MNNLGFKELYDVALKATYPIEMNGRVIEIGETVAVFDKVQIANFEEIRSQTSARGGNDNRPLIYWEDTKEVRISFTQGVFSKSQMALMTNTNLIRTARGEPTPIHQREELETDEYGEVKVSRTMASKPYIYNAKTGEKITQFTWKGRDLDTNIPYITIIVDYWFDYVEPVEIFTVGQALTNGYLSLEGRTRVKDDTTGQVTTGIIKIPKLKLLSNLSMRLGRDAVPVVGRLDAVAVPTGERGQKRVMELILLNDDIDSDI
jgi:hypothetical protein